MKMIGDIERGAAQNGRIGKLIPDDFTDGDDQIFFHKYSSCRLCFLVIKHTINEFHADINKWSGSGR